MKHSTEEELTAYQMREPEHIEQDLAVAAHLEQCSQCVARAEQIAQTLRVFSADHVPMPDMDHAWQRLRGNLPPVFPVRTRQTNTRWRWLWVPVCATLLIGSALTLHIRTPAASSGTHSGPLTEQPQSPDDAAMLPQDRGIAMHLEGAERLLTVVSHEPGALDAATRAQVRQLLLTNAVYVRQARASGNLPEVSILEDLGRTLTTLNHEPDRGWHVRMEFNTNGLLLDIRLLQQNRTHPQPAGTPQ